MRGFHICRSRIRRIQRLKITEYICCVLLLLLMTKTGFDGVTVSPDEGLAFDDSEPAPDAQEIKKYNEAEFQTFMLSIPQYSSLQLGEAYEKIRAAFMNFEEHIEVEELGLTPEDVQKYLSWVLKNNPELFYLDGSIRYGCNGDGTVTYITPSYSMDKEQALSALEFCGQELDRILFLLDKDMSDYDKALFLHDYLCENYAYDTGYVYDDMYDFLRTGKGTCQGYTFTYMALLRRCGIETTYAASDELVHIWNLIKLEDCWYHVDVTWDDGVPDKFGQAGHENFLCSDAAITKSGHYGWYSPGDIVCDSEKYDGLYIHGITRPLAYLDGVWYCVNNLPGYKKVGVYNPETDSFIGIFEVGDSWRKTGEQTQYYLSSYSSALSFDGKLYFNSPDVIHVYDPESGEISEFFRAGKDEQIYGMRLSGKNIIYILSEPSYTDAAVKSAALSYPCDGDVNGDGVINARDVSLLRIKIENKSRSENKAVIKESFYRFAADLNCDGRLDDEDIYILRKMIVNSVF